MVYAVHRDVCNRRISHNTIAAVIEIEVRRLHLNFPSACEWCFRTIVLLACHAPLCLVVLIPHLERTDVSSAFGWTRAVHVVCERYRPNHFVQIGAVHTVISEYEWIHVQICVYRCLGIIVKLDILCRKRASEERFCFPAVACESMCPLGGSIRPPLHPPVRRYIFKIEKPDCLR